MEDPTHKAEPAPVGVGEDEANSAALSSDPLTELDDIVAEVARRDRQIEERDTQEHRAMQEFLAGFQTACRTEVRPALKTVLDRLQSNGGGGVIEEHPGGEARFQNPCLFFWMSLEGDIVGEPRPDREPYLQLEADVERRDVQVSEGDMWRGAGGRRSGRVGRWQLSDLTRDRIIGELVAIARRAAS